jgi:archaellum biogenesis ATPase FlaH
MNTPIKEIVLQRTSAGNDPNDNRDDPDYLHNLKPRYKDDWMNGYKLTDEERQQLSDPVWIYPNLIIKGHILVLVAPPNGGKTTLMLWIAGEIAKKYQVIYVNSDVSGSEVKPMDIFAQEHEFTMLFPDLKAGKSMDDIVRQLEVMNNVNTDYSHLVFIFDTLKKMTDVINKARTKKLFKTLRGLSAKGMTIVLLGHPNKHLGDNGKLVFEGTGDVRADADEMIYLVHQKHPDKSMTVSTELEKVRGDFEPISFEISPDRTVMPSGKFTDVKKANELHSQHTKDSQVIKTIEAALSGGQANQSAIVNLCGKQGISSARTRRILKQYSFGSMQKWDREKGGKNSWNYKLFTPAKNTQT